MSLLNRPPAFCNCRKRRPPKRGGASNCTSRISSSQAGSAPDSQRTLPATRRPSTYTAASSRTCRPFTRSVRSSLKNGISTVPVCASMAPGGQRAGCG